MPKRLTFTYVPADIPMHSSFIQPPPETIDHPTISHRSILLWKKGHMHIEKSCVIVGYHTLREKDRTDSSKYTGSKFACLPDQGPVKVVPSLPQIYLCK